MFFDFAGGGFPGGRHQHHFHEEAQDEVEEKDYYGILEIEKGADGEQIKKAYKKALRKWHPDRFTDPVEKQVATEKFKGIQEAVEVLSDPKKRSIYDKHGNAGLQKRKGRAEEEKGENIGFEVPVTLSELYNGATKKVNFRKTVLCESCEGEGTKDKNTKRKKCSNCDGKGAKVMMRQVGPFMTQQQVKCGQCDGEGEVVPLEDRCLTCRGKKIGQKNVTIDVFVEKGMKDGQKLTFHGEAHQEPNSTPGDVIVIIKEHEEENQLEFPKFSREGNDLVYKKVVSLRQALIGFKFELKHLDGRILVISSSEGSILKPGDKKVILNEGMPAFKNPFQKGRLVIDFDVEFPSEGTFDEKTRKQLEELLTHQSDLEEKVDETNSESSHYTFSDYEEQDEEDKKKKQAYDDDEDGEEEGGNGQQGVGCRFF